MNKVQLKNVLRQAIEQDLEDIENNMDNYENLLTSLQIRDYIEKDTNLEEVEKYITEILIERFEIDKNLNIGPDDPNYEYFYDYVKSFSEDCEFDSVESFKKEVERLNSKYN